MLLLALVFVHDLYVIYVILFTMSVIRKDHHHNDYLRQRREPRYL